MADTQPARNKRSVGKVVTHVGYVHGNLDVGESVSSEQAPVVIIEGDAITDV
jgi:hypothetical protein